MLFVWPSRLKEAKFKANLFELDDSANLLLSLLVNKESSSTVLAHESKNKIHNK